MKSYENKMINKFLMIIGDFLIKLGRKINPYTRRSDYLFKKRREKLCQEKS